MQHPTGSIGRAALVLLPALAALALALGLFGIFATSASAQSPAFSCTAIGATSTVAAGSPFVVANPSATPCSSDSAESPLVNLATNLPPVTGPYTTGSVTGVSSTTAESTTTATATADVEAGSILYDANLGSGAPIITLGPITSTASYMCSDDSPTDSSSSSVSGTVTLPDGTIEPFSGSSAQDLSSLIGAPAGTFLINQTSAATGSITQQAVVLNFIDGTTSETITLGTAIAGVQANPCAAAPVIPPTPPVTPPPVTPPPVTPPPVHPHGVAMLIASCSVQGDHVRVTGHDIRSVLFKIDLGSGRTITKAPFKITIHNHRQPHTISARITFTSGARARTIHRRIEKCGPMNLTG